jgi:hypothetical protein
MARMTGFIFQDEYLERLAKLSDQEVGRLVRALAVYHATGETQELAGREGIAFDFIKVDIDRNDRRYEAKCETNRSNRAGTSTTDNDRERPSTDGNETPQIEIKIKDKDKDKELKEKVKRESRRFTPPTREEVAAYIAEKGYSVDPDRWMAHYESNGWKVGPNPMKDWKAAVRTWTHNNVDSRRPSAQVAQSNYTQRQYEERKPTETPEWLAEMLAEEAAT